MQIYNQLRKGLEIMTRFYTLCVVIVFSSLINIVSAQNGVNIADTTRPTVTIETDSLLENDAFDITITFSEAVSGFVQSDVALSGTAETSITAWSEDTTDTVYTATITPTTSGTVIINIVAGLVKDAAQNSNTAAEQLTVNVDMVVPSVEINPLIDDAQLEGVHPGGIDVPIKFSEAVSDFVQADLTLTENTAGATITAWTASEDGTTFTATITPTTSGVVTLSVAADVATDDTGNSNTAATSWTVEFDIDAPSVTITTGLDWKSPGTTIDGVHPAEFYVRAEFSEPIIPLTVNRVYPWQPQLLFITVTGATIDSTFSVNGGSIDGERLLWPLKVIADADVQEITFNVAADVVRDYAGNQNTAATELSITEFDLVAPTITAITAPSGDQTGVFDVTVTFSEPVYADKIRFTGTGYSGKIGGYTQSNPEADGTDTVTITISPSNRVYWQDTGSLQFLSMGGEQDKTFPSVRNPDYFIKDQAGNLMEQQRLRELCPRISVIRVTPYDIDEDEDVDIADIRLVVNALGQSGDSITNSRTDVDEDGDVDIDDLIAVINNFDDAAAPSSADIFTGLSPDALETLDPILLTEALDAIRLESDGSLKYLHAIGLFEHLLAAMRPDKTQLFANYPNPFNPETWIPYELADASDVMITIYDANGRIVRELRIGHQSAGYYTSKVRAAYWNGRNSVGEKVSSGVYFYQLTAGDHSYLRKMVILK